MALIAPSRVALNMPYGTGFYCRRYLVMGKLKNVKEMCKDLNQYATFTATEFSTNYSGKMPLYYGTLENQTILSTSTNGNSVGYIHPIPVNHNEHNVARTHYTIR